MKRPIVKLIGVVLALLFAPPSHAGHINGYEAVSCTGLGSSCLANMEAHVAGKADSPMCWAADTLCNVILDPKNPSALVCNDDGNTTSSNVQWYADGTCCFNPGNGSTNCPASVAPSCNTPYKICPIPGAVGVAPQNADDWSFGCNVNTSNDTSNCGDCGHSCSPNHNTPACVSGACSFTTCDAGYLNCNGGINDGCEVNAFTDVNNCGGCNHACSLPHTSLPTCSSGTCGFDACATGFGNCNGVKSDGCEINLTGGDTNNCGGCGTACNSSTVQNATGFLCAASKCDYGACNTGFGDCDMNRANGCETNTTNSLTHCGGCNTTCTVPAHTAAAQCTSGACGYTSCSAGYADCNNIPADGCETNIVSGDPNNCGGCGIGHVCGPANVQNAQAYACTNSLCDYTACATGYGDCDGNRVNGCETHTTGSDVNNCGGCGIKCPSGATAAICTNGVCGFSGCPAGEQSCPATPVTCNTTPATDVSNCGGCGVVCSAEHVSAKSCTAGICTSDCAAGFGDCDGNKQTNGCEVDLKNDPANCGACGAACNVQHAAALCSLGVCGYTACAVGYSDCDGNTANGCETQGNSCPTLPPSDLGTAVDMAGATMTTMTTTTDMAGATTTTTTDMAGATTTNDLSVTTREGDMGGIQTGGDMASVSKGHHKSGGCDLSGDEPMGNALLPMLLLLYAVFAARRKLAAS